MNESRGRLVFAAAALTVLIAAVVAVAVSGSSDDDSADECLAIWNDDAAARSDGQHAWDAHGYSATLLTRVNPDGALVADADTEGAPTPQSRCAVVFASPQVDAELDFGVRVYDDGAWAGLALVDQVPIEQIGQMQRDATASANVTLLPDGRLAD